MKIGYLHLFRHHWHCCRRLMGKREQTAVHTFNLIWSVIIVTEDWLLASALQFDVVLGCQVAFHQKITDFADPPKLERRWFRFRLGTFMIAVTSVTHARKSRWLDEILQQTGWSAKPFLVAPQPDKPQIRTRGPPSKSRSVSSDLTWLKNLLTKPVCKLSKLDVTD